MIDSILAVGAILSANLADIPTQQLELNNKIEEVKHHTNSRSQRGVVPSQITSSEVCVTAGCEPIRL